MNRVIGFGVAVALSIAAAGFGAYLAFRPQPAAVPAATVAEVATQSAQTAESAAAPVADAQAPLPDPAPGTTLPAAPARRGNAGAATAGPPASQETQVAVRPVEAVSAAAPPDTIPVPPPVLGQAVPQAPPPPPQRTFEELVVSADSVIGLRIESTVSSEVAKIEDPVEARVTRDVRVGSEIAIPAGARVLGSVMQVERGGKMKNAARIGVRFHTLVLADNTRIPMQTEAVYRIGKSPGNESAVKVGGAAVGGAILGAIIGGGKGAAIGGSVGAAGGTAAVMAGGRNPAILASGTSLTVRLSQPVAVVVEREELRD